MHSTITENKNRMTDTITTKLRLCYYCTSATRRNNPSYKQYSASPHKARNKKTINPEADDILTFRRIKEQMISFVRKRQMTLFYRPNLPKLKNEQMINIYGP